MQYNQYCLLQLYQSHYSNEHRDVLCLSWDSRVQASTLAGSGGGIGWESLGTQHPFGFLVSFLYLFPLWGGSRATLLR